MAKYSCHGRVCCSVSVTGRELFSVALALRVPFALLDFGRANVLGRERLAALGLAVHRRTPTKGLLSNVDCVNMW